MSKYRTHDLTEDSTGLFAVYPSHCSHAYTYNPDGTIATDTATSSVSGYVFVKTYTWTSGRLTGESAWVKQ